ncbi:hypothetical protein Tco_0613493 [Tanacetum coccineum]
MIVLYSSSCVTATCAHDLGASTDTLSLADEIMLRSNQPESDTWQSLGSNQEEPLTRKRMRELRLQGVATRLNHSSDDVDKERKLEAPPGFWSQPPGGAEEPAMEGIPLLIAAHLRETERRRRTLSPIGASDVRREPPNRVNKMEKEGNCQHMPTCSCCNFKRALAKSGGKWRPPVGSSQKLQRPKKEVSNTLQATKKADQDSSSYQQYKEKGGELKSQIEEAIKSGKLAHLVKEIQKGKAKLTDT